MKGGWKIKLLSALFVPFATRAENADGMTQSAASSDTPQFFPGEESHRLSFILGTPRRFATRFLSDSRTLQIRVAPAQAHEFDVSRHYDTRYIQRIVVEEKKGEVVLSLQLKNAPLAWLVVPQFDPWRLTFDLWRTEPVKRMDLEAAWDWQQDLFQKPEAQGTTHKGEATSAPHSGNAATGINSATRPSAGTAAANAPYLAQPNAPGLQNAGLQNSAASETGSKGQWPDNFHRLDIVTPPSSQKREQIASYERSVGRAMGTPEELEAAEKLAYELYGMGEDEKALALFRRIAALSERQFKANPRMMWLSGETAYLRKNWDLATDYFRSLLLHHPSHEVADFARMRLLDIAYLTSADGQANKPISANMAKAYSEIALSEKSPWQAKIVSSLRILHGIIDQSPDSANLYQQNINACVNRTLVPIDMRKNCAYIQTRYALEKLDVASSDLEVQRFKKSFPGDTRTRGLEVMIEKLIRSNLEEAQKNKSWDGWVEFEGKARSGLLDFTLKDSGLVFARAEGWEAVGERRKAAQLYGLYWQLSEDGQKKNEAAAINSRLLYKIGDPERAESYLKRLENSDFRKASGLGDRALGAVREISLAPHRSKRALRLILDEMRHGRFVERELNALVQFAGQMRGQPAADQIHEKILTYPAKTADEIRQVETSTLQFADTLKDTGRFAKSGDMYLAVANVPQGTRRAEASYKAGIVYARAGQLEKARAAWQMASADLNDKKYSSLANERLERIR